MDIENIKVRIASYTSVYAQSDLKWHYRCCELALEALERGNYGVGAVLVDKEGGLVAEAQNQVFSDGFDSAGHAEMKVIDLLEHDHCNGLSPEELTLIVSLEPCPMCSCRIFAAGIGQVIYMSKDKNGGMMSHCNRLPPAWNNLSQLTVSKQFNDKHELAVLAQDIASAQIGLLRRKLIATIRG